MADIAVPKLNNNDTVYTLLEWLAENGQEVSAEQAVVVLETSKAAEELPCESGGILHQLIPMSAECKPGDVIGRLFDSERERQEFLASQPTAQPEQEQSVSMVITDAAADLARQHDISEEQLRGLGKLVIKSADVQALAAQNRPGQRSLPVNRAQQAVAAVVSESHRTIPPAFVLAKADVGAAIAAARVASERDGMLVGLPELLIKALAGLYDDFPAFFATLSGDSLTVADTPRIGVTVDAGRGLYVPVLANPAEMSIADLADALMDLRIRALRGQFRESDLAGAAIVVSLANDDGLVFSAPIVFPGQVCILSLGGSFTELDLADDGTVSARKAAHLGISYDHRAVNGRDAGLFLRALCRSLESPEPLITTGSAR